jgi:hypothetical protein
MEQSLLEWIWEIGWNGNESSGYFSFVPLISFALISDIFLYLSFCDNYHFPCYCHLLFPFPVEGLCLSYLNEYEKLVEMEMKLKLKQVEALTVSNVNSFVVSICDTLVSTAHSLQPKRNSFCISWLFAKIILLFVTVNNSLLYFFDKELYKK